MTRRGYPAEFRRRVVGLVEGGRRISEIETELGGYMLFEYRDDSPYTMLPFRSQVMFVRCTQ